MPLTRGHRVRHRADPAYPADDGLNILEASFADHGFKESRRLRDLPLYVFDFAVTGAEPDVAVPLDARDVMYANIHFFGHYFSCSVPKSTILL